MSSISPSLPVSHQCPPQLSADFHPTVWGDYFSQFSAESMEEHDKMEKQAEELKEEVKKMLINTKLPLPKLQLIDTIQRLGVSYHFEQEIDHSLQQIHRNYTENNVITMEGDLRALSLVFRLLRQHGFHISPENGAIDIGYGFCTILHYFDAIEDVFERFMRDKNSNMIGDNSSSDDNVEGVLSLFEAAHLAVHGEDILDEALSFTTAYLSSIITRLSPCMATKVTYSLRHPLVRDLPRLKAWHYISTHQQDPFHDKTLLAFAKLDFNLLQFLYRKEVANLTEWWKELDFARKLPYARDRMVECYYLWGLSSYFEPWYSWGRQITTKMAYILTALDDTYDARGTFEELQLFTKAFERLDMGCMEYLPEYMRVIYKAWFDFCEEIRKETTKEGRGFCADFLIDSLRTDTLAYMEEAKWLKNKYKPTFEEYIGVTERSIGQQPTIMASFICMGTITTKNILAWLSEFPKIIKASSVICRLMDDVVTNEFEQKRGHIGSSIECYMKQHCVKREDAIVEIRKIISDGWKDINQELLKAEMAKPLLCTILSMTCVVDVFYKDSDGYTESGGFTKDQIKDILLHPFPL